VPALVLTPVEALGPDDVEDPAVPSAWLAGELLRSGVDAVAVDTERLAGGAPNTSAGSRCSKKNHSSVPLPPISAAKP
jgi:hypothetical protein